MFPLALLGILGLVTMFALKSKHAPPTPQLKTAGRTLSAPRPQAPSDPTRNLKLLKRIIRNGQTPQKWVVNEAMREAYDRGDWNVVGALASTFCRSPQAPDAPPATDAAPNETPSPAQDMTSKLDGVSDDEWSDFVAALKTQSPEYKSGKHVGAWHQNIERLTQLGIAPESLEGEPAQYEALSKDLESYFASERQLIRDVCGDVVTVDGIQHPVTMSGVLALLKAAGPKNTRAWFRSAEDRAAFPKTAETFVKANGIF